MPPTTIMLIDHDPARRAHLQQVLADAGYRTVPQAWQDDLPRAMVDAQPVAVAVQLPSDGPPQREAAMLTALHTDPAIREIPVLLCSDNPVLRADAVRKLQPRAGVVTASSSSVDELVAKLKAVA